MPPTGKSTWTDYVYVMQFEDGTLKHLTKMWNAGWAMKELGWPDLEQPQSKNQPATQQSDLSSRSEPDTRSSVGVDKLRGASILSSERVGASSEPREH
jgi:hypothetical protein